MPPTQEEIRDQKILDEIKISLKYMKNNKTPRDGVTSMETIKMGGTTLLKILSKGRQTSVSVMGSTIKFKQ